jgi:hypothetical protein
MSVLIEERTKLTEVQMTNKSRQIEWEMNQSSHSPRCVVTLAGTEINFAL